MQSKIVRTAVAAGRPSMWATCGMQMCLVDVITKLAAGWKLSRIRELVPDAWAAARKSTDHGQPIRPVAAKRARQLRFLPGNGSAVEGANLDNDGRAEVYVSGMVVRGDCGEIGVAKVLTAGRGKLHTTEADDAPEPNGASVTFVAHVRIQVLPSVRRYSKG